MQLVKKIIPYIILILSTYLLTSCIIPSTNMNGVNNNNSAPLPHPIANNKALIYIVNPYKSFFIYLVLDGGGVEDVSNVYIQSAAKDQRYLGKLILPSDRYLCIYVDPGRYRLIANSEHAQPKHLTQEIEVKSNQAYFYGLHSNAFNSTSNFHLEFQHLTLINGKNYLSQTSKHESCLDFSKLPHDITYKRHEVSLQIKNESLATYAITEANGKMIHLNPNQIVSYHWTYGEKIPNSNRFKKFTFQNQAGKTEQIIGFYSGSPHWSLSNEPFGFYNSKSPAFVVLNADCANFSSDQINYQDKCTAKIVDQPPKENLPYRTAISLW
jgi:hypothetical protein